MTSCRHLFTYILSHFFPNAPIIPVPGDPIEPQEAIPSMQQPTPSPTHQTGEPEKYTDAEVADDQLPLK